MFLIRWIIAAILIVTAVPWSYQLLLDTWQGFRWSSVPHAPWMLGGLVIGVCWILWRKPNWLLHTAIHESCHFLACLLMGVRVRSFQASDGKGGKVIHDKVDPLRATIISLAPYTLPLLLLPLLIWRSYYPRIPWLAALIVFAWILHLHGLYHNIRLNFWGRQADLSKAGKPLSIAAITAILLLVSTWTLRVLLLR